MGKKKQRWRNVKKSRAVSSIGSINEQEFSSKEKEDDVDIDISRSFTAQKVQAHRKRLRALGFRAVSVYLPGYVYERLQEIKAYRNKTYATLFEEFINKEYLKLMRANRKA